MRYLIIGMFLGLFIAHVGTAHAERITLSNGTQVEITVVEDVCSAVNPNGCEFGSTEYCTYYFDADDGTVTFDRVNAVRACDTSGDGWYNYCDDYVRHHTGGYTFEDQWHYRMCEVYGQRDFNPIQDRIVDGG